MPSILETYRQERNAARDEFRTKRTEVQQIIDASDLMWREKLILLNKMWSNSVQAVLARTAPLCEPGMHPSSWQNGFNDTENAFQVRCENFTRAMDNVLSGFPAPEVPKRKTRKK